MHKVKCYYCGSTFDRDKEPNVPISGIKRYAHEKCFALAQKANEQEKEDARKLETYIKNLFGYQHLPERVNKQIREYITDKNYTYAGILRALKYFYEVKHGDKEKAYGKISIVSYVYDEAFNYYYAIWQARQQNIGKKVTSEEIEIRIPSPKREPMQHKKRLFSFLEEESN